jgi:hypothetical protein
MRKRDLMRALAEESGAQSTQKPPERAVFFQNEEMKSCCSILERMVTDSLKTPRLPGNRAAIPLPDANLPMIF